VRQYLILLSLLFCACTAGNGDGLDTSGRPIGEAPDPNDQPTLANIQARIFTPICVQCHVGAGAPQGLRLDSTYSFADLVGVPSREASSLNRVEPFDPDRSYMFQKISGTAAVGVRMPLGGPVLSNEDIELVRQWIADGALPASAGLNSNAGKALGASASRVDGTLVIRITVSNELDMSSLLPSSFRIVGSGDAEFGNDDDQEIFNFVTHAASGTPYGIVIRVGQPGADASRLKLTLGGTTMTHVLDLSGRPIDSYTFEFNIESQ